MSTKASTQPPARVTISIVCGVCGRKFWAQLGSFCHSLSICPDPACLAHRGDSVSAEATR